MNGTGSTKGPAIGKHKTMLQWIQFKTSEIILQVVVVVISILLALAVDEWRDNKQQQELADRAQKGVIEELKANQKELAGTLATNDSIFQLLVPFLQGKQKFDGGVPFSAAQLSSAAWHMAQGTQALHRIDFNRLLLFARTHELQSVYGTSQSRLLENLGESWNEKREEVRIAKRKLVFQLATVNEVGRALAKQYNEALADPPAIK